MDALAPLTSPVVLAFLLGLSAALMRSDLRLPEQVHGFLSLYLLLAIGLKGGVGLRGADLGDLALPVLVTLVLGVVTPLLAFGVLRLMTRLSTTDRAALAAHYGSTSLVTFTAAIAALDAARVSTEGYLATLLAVLEVPGIVVGLLLAGRAAGGSRREAFREVLTGKSILLLVGGLAIGAVTGASGYVAVEPLFGGLFQGVLVLFLLDLGVLAGQRLRDVPQAGVGLVAAALLLPLVNGTLGVLGGTAAGLSVGGAAVLGVLAASASYIAAPAAVRLALPEANPAYYLTSSLGITFPFNLVVGIPLLLGLAQSLR
ncbi:MAG TPA: sodium-dependent bicarbonate transport family permease [Mycobacteriales bacterium]|nr:sodium-dependent bicarbonate transport family permease [Mycobacteriales bacterium]